MDEEKGEWVFFAFNIIAIIASSNFSSNAKRIDVKPIHTPISVSIFGNIILAFFYLPLF